MWTIPFVGFWLRDFSYFYYFIELRFNRLAENIGLKQKYQNNLFEIYQSEANKNYKKEIYSEIWQITHKKDIPVILVNFPILYNLKEYQFENINTFVKSLAEENNFSYLNMLDTFKVYNADSLVVNKYDAHPNELGHQLIAEKLYEEISKLSSLD